MNIVIAIIILLAYIIAICIKGGGVPSSLSASVFDLTQNKRWIWTVVLASVCFLCLVPFDFLPYSVSYLDKVSEGTQFLAFVALAALAFVGAAPLVADKTDLAYKVHCGPLWCVRFALSWCWRLMVPPRCSSQGGVCGSWRGCISARTGRRRPSGPKWYALDPRLHSV